MKVARKDPIPQAPASSAGEKPGQLSTKVNLIGNRYKLECKPGSGLDKGNIFLLDSTKEDNKSVASVHCGVIKMMSRLKNFRSICLKR
jgi:hypothetical protein